MFTNLYGPVGDLISFLEDSRGKRLFSFNTNVKDAQPYNSKWISDDTFLILVKTLGIAEEDLTLELDTIDRVARTSYALILKGETKVDDFDFTNTVKIGFNIDGLMSKRDIKNVEYYSKNGLTYIHINLKPDAKKRNIDIVRVSPELRTSNEDLVAKVKSSLSNKEDVIKDFDNDPKSIIKPKPVTKKK